MAEFRMPSLGADMNEGTLRKWLVKPGDKVNPRDLVAEVETEKGLVDAEVFHGGVVEKLLVEEGAQVPVGTPLALIREEGEVAAAPPVPTPPPQVAPPPASAPPTPALVPAVPPPTSGRIRVSPLARRRASELRIDLGHVAGSGPDGAVTVEDVERSVAPGGPTRPATPAGPTGMRQVIASAMARSKREIPHYYLSTTLDLGPALAWLASLNVSRPVADRFVPAVLFVRAVALALRDFPELNARWVHDAAPPIPEIRVGVAVSLRGGGLVAPAIPATDTLPLDGLMKTLVDVVQRARTGGLRTSEMFEGTITLTNLGERGVETVFPVIYPPQVAIVGVGRVVERPWVVNGRVLARPVVTLTLAADHRVSDGHRGALFLAAVESLLAAPEKLQ